MKCKVSNNSRKEPSTRALVFRLFFLIYIGAVAYLCFGKMDNLPEINKSILGIPTDKIVHFCMFFPFPIIAFFAVDKKHRNIFDAFKSFLQLCSIGCIFAGLTEMAQGLLPYRSEDILDFAADSLSIVLSSLLVLILDLRAINIERNSLNYHKPNSR